MNREKERGAALIMTLLTLGAFSILGAAILFTVQTQTQISANYRYGEQAFYVANAGIQKSLAWFNSAYVPPTPAPAYDTTKVPVQYGGQDVILSGKPGAPSTHPDSVVVNSFSSQFGNGNNKLEADSKNSGFYQASATLLRTRAVQLLDPLTFTVSLGALERWRLDCTGLWHSDTNPLGTKDISAVIERQGSPFWAKALWTLDSATIRGPSFVDSYDPDLGPYGGSNVGNGGSIGSNGNITLEGQAEIRGDATYGGTFSESGNASVTGDVSELPEPKIFPPIPAFTVGTANVTVDGGNPSVTLEPGSYSKIYVGGQGTLTLSGGTYYIDQVLLEGGGKLIIPDGVSVTLFVKTSLDVAGGQIVNTGQDPSAFQIFYSGTKTARLAGGSGFYGTVYAPNALLELAGGSNYYGSFISKSLDAAGGANIHYDEGLLREFITPTPYRIITWTQNNF